MTDNIFWNDKGQPVSNHFDDIYFSTENGLAETDYVFLQQNQLAQRFSTLEPCSSFTIAETGFGTGLNFLACCALWRKTAPQEASLHFISTEKYPLSRAAIQQAAALWPELSTETAQLLSTYPSTIACNQATSAADGVDFYRLNISPHICLTLIIGDATMGLSHLLARKQPSSALHNTSTEYASESRQWRGVDAWFLDGFAPAKNPDMWTEHLFSTISALSKPNSTIATFTAAGMVRRGLSNAGFQITKIRGYDKKREMLSGIYIGNTGGAITETREKTTTHSMTNNSYAHDYPQNSHKLLSTWALIENYQATPTQQRIAVIGGGIAGCHTAYALAKKGYQVTLFEQANSLAAGASGNGQGVVYGKLSAAGDPLGEINRYSLRYAQTFYQDYWNSTTNHHAHGQACGVLQLSMTDKDQQAHSIIAEHVINDPALTRYISASEASQIANTTIPSSALYFPKSGWIHPPSLCLWLVQHPNITLCSNTEITQLEQIQPPSLASQHVQPQWQLHYTQADQISSAMFDSVIICNAYDAARFTQTKTLPIKKIRGQVTHYPANQTSEQLRTAVCGKGYIAPSSHQMHCLGASFNLHETNTALNEDDHKHNLANISLQTPEIITAETQQHIDYASLDGRVSFRCVTPDYLPIVGAVPIISSVETRYQALTKNGRQVVDCAGAYYPNLYINIGHGSRGLAYTPLCSEMLASLIHGDPPPMPQYLIQKLNPARFTIRQLIRSPR